MLALTLREPWASAVVHAGKRTENRSWTTPYRGILAVHAGKAIDVSADAMTVGNALRQRVPSGHIVAVVTLLDVVRDSVSEWARDGCYHWLLDGLRRVEPPVPCIGRQSLFRVPLDVERDVLAALATPAGGV